MLQLINDLPEKVLGVSAEGKVTGKDYETILVPAVEEKFKHIKKSGCCTSSVPTFQDLILVQWWMMLKSG